MLPFKDIKQNYPVYIFDKQNLTLVQGKVAQISFPHLEVGFCNTGRQNMVVDVTVVVDAKTATYTIPENLGLTETQSGLVLATEKESLTVELETLKNNAELVLDSIDRQKLIIEKVDQLLQEIKPQSKEKAEYEKRFKNLESGMNSIKDLLEKYLKTDDDSNKKKGRRREDEEGSGE